MSDKNKWSPSYSVGVETIDDDHKHLFALVDDLRTALQNEGRGFRKIVNGLTQYIHGHFEREEYLMLETNYPDYAQHVKNHRKFMRLVYAVRKIMSEQPELLDMTKMLRFLEQWLVNHIKIEDVKLGMYLKTGYVNKGTNWDQDLSRWITLREGDEDSQELITIKNRVPLSAAIVMRRCARILNDGGEEAEALTDYTDPTKFLSTEDAVKLANMLLVHEEETED
jgi:hemerythrin